MRRKHGRHARWGRRSGLTLLEVVVASGLSLVVLAGGLTVGVHMQRRALHEEQVMLAQVTARAVKELVSTELMRAGMGTGNSAIALRDGVERFPLEVRTGADAAAVEALFEESSSDFSPAPSSGPYQGMSSDALLMTWGDAATLTLLDDCNRNGAYRVLKQNDKTFCLNPVVAPALMEQVEGRPGEWPPAVVVHPGLQRGCSVELKRFTVDPDRTPTGTYEFMVEPGKKGSPLRNGQCADRRPPHEEDMWSRPGWLVMHMASSGYRVNWKSGQPVLEYRDMEQQQWQGVSRDVEQLKVRMAVWDPAPPRPEDNPYWFPDPRQGRPGLDQCTRDISACMLPSLLPPAPALASDAELRAWLQRRVRELEITLVVRTPRPRRELMVPGAPPDAEGQPQDGYQRMTLTFRINPRNFAYSGGAALGGTPAPRQPPPQQRGRP
jgi:type IV pilus assembly protein PilW